MKIKNYTIPIELTEDNKKIPYKFRQGDFGQTFKFQLLENGSTIIMDGSDTPYVYILYADNKVFKVDSKIDTNENVIEVKMPIAFSNIAGNQNLVIEISTLDGARYTQQLSYTVDVNPAYNGGIIESNIPTLHKLETDKMDKDMNNADITGLRKKLVDAGSVITNADDNFELKISQRLLSKTDDGKTTDLLYYDPVEDKVIHGDYTHNVEYRGKAMFLSAGGAPVVKNITIDKDGKITNETEGFMWTDHNREAPKDDKVYGRSNGSWVETSDNKDVSFSKLTDTPSTFKGFSGKILVINNAENGIEYTDPVKGDKGDIGPQGIQGPEGPKGKTGDTGLQGKDGPMGPEGPIGKKGIPGTNGKDGKDGLRGNQGDKGIPGDKGDTGPQGPAGVGLKNKGNWTTGTVYKAGDYVFSVSSKNAAFNSMWILSSDNYTSSKLPKDDTANWVEFEAPKGEKGDPGRDGLDGRAGSDGKPGRDGLDGRKGDDGLQGRDGAQGPAGKDGKDGKNGTSVTAVSATTNKDNSMNLRFSVGTLDLPTVKTPILKGDKGDTGPQGKIGPTGPAGLDGKQGPAGRAGDIGKTGPKGDPGEVKGIVLNSDNLLITDPKDSSKEFIHLEKGSASIKNTSGARILDSNPRTVTLYAGGSDGGSTDVLSLAKNYLEIKPVESNRPTVFLDSANFKLSANYDDIFTTSGKDVRLGSYSGHNLLQRTGDNTYLMGNGNTILTNNSSAKTGSTQLMYPGNLNLIKGDILKNITIGASSATNDLRLFSKNAPSWNGKELLTVDTANAIADVVSMNDKNGATLIKVSKDDGVTLGAESNPMIQFNNTNGLVLKQPSGMPVLSLGTDEFNVSRGGNGGNRVMHMSGDDFNLYNYKTSGQFINANAKTNKFQLFSYGATSPIYRYEPAAKTVDIRTTNSSKSLITSIDDNITVGNDVHNVKLVSKAPVTINDKKVPLVYGVGRTVPSSSVGDEGDIFFKI